MSYCRGGIGEESVSLCMCVWVGCCSYKLNSWLLLSMTAFLLEQSCSMLYWEETLWCNFINFSNSWLSFTLLKIICYSGGSVGVCSTIHVSGVWDNLYDVALPGRKINQTEKKFNFEKKQLAIKRCNDAIVTACHNLQTCLCGDKVRSLWRSHLLCNWNIQ